MNILIGSIKLYVLIQLSLVRIGIDINWCWCVQCVDTDIAVIVQSEITIYASALSFIIVVSNFNSIKIFPYTKGLCVFGGFTLQFSMNVVFKLQTNTCKLCIFHLLDR